MDTNNVLHAEMTVEEVLKRWPETWGVFRSKKTDCIGCFTQRFCTLQEVAETYQISLKDLLGELETCVTKSNITQRSIV